ncbi:hypothetical protein LTR05_001772 [Lithohypha guttulata]|uniref:Heterokaryon incompatibility domain-containing protein n=1 Tax=Lithohypha guttulata TaxID=1690604 RepID=A0AAN7YAL7_9EURO|nr:hypothetical protein LTR05_001772 [Lithohypha guttulata]
MATRPPLSYADMAHHASFEHERLTLSDKSIRLFQVQRGGKDEPISLRMTQFSAARRPKYKAVSYTWGSARHPKQVLVNGRAFSLHLNLWHLLYHLRLSEETSFLWADALCINQLNLRERNFHVQLMGRIYQEAESVIVWLGLPSADRTEIRAMDFIKEISAYRTRYSDTMLINTYLRPDIQHRWETLCRMTNHYYWHRTWIIQEFLFAPSIEVFSGKEKLDWKEFEDVVELLRSDPKFATHAVIPQILQSRTTRLTMRRKAGSMSSLHELLREYADSTCTERRDKVYGILGLASDCSEDPDTGETFGVKPDYEKHIVKVYLDALECIKASLPTNSVLPAATLLILRALHILGSDLGSYVSNLDLSAHIRTPLVVSPAYVSSVITVFNWTSVRDLQRQLEMYDWGEHIGYQIKKIPSNTLIPGNKIPKMRRHSSNSRQVHSDLPPDFIYNVVEAANLCTDLSSLYNYPCHHDLNIPLEHIPLHSADKRLHHNPDLLKPPVILEQRPGSETLRLGFACTDVQRGDLILQFRGLDTTLIIRQIGFQTMLVGKAMTVKNAAVIHEETIDPICEQNSWASHCWCARNPEEIQLETDPLSLAELLMKT